MIKGKVHKYGDDINTDVIFPGRYTYKNLSEEEMAQHAMEDLDPTFLDTMEKGDIVVAGRNFGCGSSREQAATCRKYAGVGAIIAKSFSRLYYRNAINQGLLIIISEEAHDKISKGDNIRIHLSTGVIENLTTGEKIHFKALPDFVLKIVESGGLIPYLRTKLGTDQK